VRDYLAFHNGTAEFSSIAFRGENRLAKTEKWQPFFWALHLNFAKPERLSRCGFGGKVRRLKTLGGDI